MTAAGAAATGVAPELAALAAAAAAASARIAPHVRRTPLEDSPWLSGAGRCRAYLKLESEQVTGSFKARGAVNKLLSLPPPDLARGLVTCSTGNHALAFVHAVSRAGGRGALGRSTIYLPTSAAPVKVEKLRLRGARLEMFGDDCADAEREARRVAGERGQVYVSPYNDPEVMAGQGTISLEILEQLREQEAAEAASAAAAAAGSDGGTASSGFGGERLRATEAMASAAATGGQVPAAGGEAGPELVVYVPVGGGGLIGGMAAVLKAALGPRARVVGCQPAASDVMRQSVEAGRIVDVPSESTLSDATAGGIEEGSVTLAPCIAGVDEWVCVTEQEIADAMAGVLKAHSKLVEGAAGCAVAAFWRQRAGLAGRTAVVLCCGGNVSAETLQDVLARGRPLSVGAAARQHVAAGDHV